MGWTPPPDGTNVPTTITAREGHEQALTALHRLRQGYQQTRTARINTVRGLLREFGVTIPTGASYVLPRARAALADDRLPTYLRHALHEALEEIATLERQAQAVQDQLDAAAPVRPARAAMVLAAAQSKLRRGRSAVVSPIAFSSLPVSA
jgi:transposase